MTILCGSLLLASSFSFVAHATACTVNSNETDDDDNANCTFDCAANEDVNVKVTKNDKTEEGHADASCGDATPSCAVPNGTQTCEAAELTGTGAQGATCHGEIADVWWAPDDGFYLECTTTPPATGTAPIGETKYCVVDGLPCVNTPPVCNIAPQVCHTRNPLASSPLSAACNRLPQQGDLPIDAACESTGPFEREPTWGVWMAILPSGAHAVECHLGKCKEVLPACYLVQGMRISCYVGPHERPASSETWVSMSGLPLTG